MSRLNTPRDAWRVIAWQFGNRDQILADETRMLATSRWGRNTIPGQRLDPLPRSVDRFGLDVTTRAHELATVDASIPSDRRTIVSYALYRNGVWILDGVSSRPVPSMHATRPSTTDVMGWSAS